MTDSKRVTREGLRTALEDVAGPNQADAIFDALPAEGWVSGGTVTGPSCTCKPPSGVTRNHDNGCALFDVRAAYRQGAAESSLDVRRVVQAMVNIAKRHGIGKDPAEPVALMHIYGYSRATPDMDAEVATEYAALSDTEAKPSPQYTEDDPDWAAMVSPISETDGGHDDR